MAGAASRVHGGPQDVELGRLGVDPSRLLDFSVSTNPYGPCQAVAAAVREATLDRYPDPTGRRVREALGAWLGRSADQVVLGHGAAELLWTLARALLRRGDAALIVEPTFGELRAAAEAVGATVWQWRARAEDRFAIDLPAVAARAADVGARLRLIYLCVPNTPTGVAVPAEEIARWAATLASVTVVLDQSFLSLSDRAADASVAMPDNVVVVRSLTKDHGIPGVRVGYLLARAAVAAAVEAQRPAWSTSAMAQAAAAAACGAVEAGFVAACRLRLREDRERIAARLRDELDVVTLPSTAPFLLAELRDAARLRARLLGGHGILVRDCASFGLPGHIRIAARPAADAERLIAGLKEELHR